MIEKIGDATLMLGDCLDRMQEIPDGSIDMICTDPPYGMEFKSNHRTVGHKKIANDDNLDWIDDFAAHCFRTAKKDTAHYVFCSFHKVDIFKQAFEKLFTLKDILIWEKNNTGMGDLEGSFAPKYEMILFLQKGRRKINGSRDPNVIRTRKTDNGLHPTQKSVPLMEYLLSKFSERGDLILDPFMGSGTTGVACESTGRKFTGIEMDEGYFEICKDRIFNAQKRLL